MFTQIIEYVGERPLMISAAESLIDNTRLANGDRDNLQENVIEALSWLGLAINHRSLGSRGSLIAT